MEEVERVVEKLSERDVEDLMHSLDRPLLIDGEQVLRNEEARILCKDGGNMQKFMKTLRELIKKAGRRTRG
jgi:hypothetical protein